MKEEKPERKNDKNMNKKNREKEKEDFWGNLFWFPPF